MMDHNVYIIDDDASARDDIRRLAKSVGINALEFKNGKDFISIQSQLTPGCLIIDVGLPIISGIALQKKLNKLGAAHPIVFVTAMASVATAVEAMKNGAIDFIQKPFNEQQLLDSINIALNKVSTSTNKVGQDINYQSIKQKLTPRELQVLDLLVQGYQNKSIAREFNISPRTVEAHRQHILNKFEVKTVIQLMHRYQYHVDLHSNSL